MQGQGLRKKLPKILGYIVILEIPDIATCIGGSIILFGLLIFNYSRRKTGLQQKES